MIQRYNSNMGGVDRIDQNISCYRILIRSCKLWWPLFAYLLDVAMQTHGYFTGWLQQHRSSQWSSWILEEIYATYISGVLPQLVDLYAVQRSWTEEFLLKLEKIELVTTWYKLELKDGVLRVEQKLKIRAVNAMAGFTLLVLPHFIANLTNNYIASLLP